MATKFSVVVFEESRGGKPAQPFLATRDPEIVRKVSDLISHRLRDKQSPVQHSRVIPEAAK
jgi:hypothetical protein